MLGKHIGFIMVSKNRDPKHDNVKSVVVKRFTEGTQQSNIYESILHPEAFSYTIPHGFCKTNIKEFLKNHFEEIEI